MTMSMTYRLSCWGGWMYRGGRLQTLACHRHIYFFEVIIYSVLISAMGMIVLVNTSQANFKGQNDLSFQDAEMGHLYFNLGYLDCFTCGWNWKLYIWLFDELSVFVMLPLHVSLAAWRTFRLKYLLHLKWPVPTMMCAARHTFRLKYLLHLKRPVPTVKCPL